MTSGKLTIKNRSVLINVVVVTAMIALAACIMAWYTTKTDDAYNMAAQTTELRKAAKSLFFMSQTANRDVTETLINANAIYASDSRAREAMKELVIDDGYPYDDKVKRVLRNGQEVHVIARDGEFYVEFHGVDPSKCQGIKYAVCIK